MIATKSVKPLNPRSPDTKVMGHEPEWREQPMSGRISALSKAFAWYNYFYGKKDARDMIVSYLEAHGRKSDVRLLRGVPDSSIRTTTAWLCRMTQVGLELNEDEQAKLDTMLAAAELKGRREALLEAIDCARNAYESGDVLERLINMAKELET